jgi:hypothetical protein
LSLGVREATPFVAERDIGNFGLAGPATTEFVKVVGPLNWVRDSGGNPTVQLIEKSME